jgi:hypothetical protein
MSRPTLLWALNGAGMRVGPLEGMEETIQETSITSRTKTEVVTRHKYNSSIDQGQVQQRTVLFSDGT